MREACQRQDRQTLRALVAQMGQAYEQLRGRLAPLVAILMAVDQARAASA